MAQPSLLTGTLWAATTLMQAAISASLLTRRTWREIPMFLTYTVWQVASSAVAYWVYTRGVYRPYFYTAWSIEVVNGVLGFLVIRELFTSVFGSYERLDRVAGTLFQWASVLLVVVASVTAAAATGSESSRILQGVLGFLMANSILSGGLLFLLFSLSSLLRLRWKEALLGIAVGFALFSTANLIAVVYRIHVGQPSAIFERFKMVAYNGATIVWAVYCLRKQRQAVMPGAVSHSDLERWNRELAQFV